MSSLQVLGSAFVSFFMFVTPFCYVVTQLSFYCINLEQFINFNIGGAACREKYYPVCQVGEESGLKILLCFHFGIMNLINPTQLTELFRINDTKVSFQQDGFQK